MSVVAMYYLRATRGGINGRKKCYLNGVSDDGLLATFTAETKLAWSFDRTQRDDFIAKHPHIKGRWVSLHNELARIRAAAAPTPKGEQHG